MENRTDVLTYFDLTDADRKRYRIEFEKTYGGKKRTDCYYILLKVLRFTIILLLFLGTLNYIFSLIGFEPGTDFIAGFMGGFVETLGLLFLPLFLLYIALVLWIRICFISWLKNKYNIRKW